MSQNNFARDPKRENYKEDRDPAIDFDLKKISYTGAEAPKKDTPVSAVLSEIQDKQKVILAQINPTEDDLREKYRV